MENSNPWYSMAGMRWAAPCCAIACSSGLRVGSGVLVGVGVSAGVAVGVLVNAWKMVGTAGVELEDRICVQARRWFEGIFAWIRGIFWEISSMKRLYPLEEFCQRNIPQITICPIGDS
jgi:hypothetical protein